MSGTPSGQRRYRIEFQRATTPRQQIGTKAPPQWTSLGHDRAKVLFGSGQERREAGVENASQAATFRCLANSKTRGITAKDRIQFAGLAWDITAIAPLMKAPAEIEFTATASRG